MTKFQRILLRLAVVASACAAAALLPKAFAESAPLILTEPYLLSLNPSGEMNVCWLLSAPAGLVSLSWPGRVMFSGRAYEAKATARNRKAALSGGRGCGPSGYVRAGLHLVR